MKNESLDPNRYLKAFYSSMVLCKSSVVIGTESLGTYAWWDTGFTAQKRVKIPKQTKKATFRVIIPEGTVAPKYPVFVSLDGLTNINTVYNDDGVVITNLDYECISLLDGSEIEVYGYDEIKKIMFFNNRVKSGAGIQPKFNAVPISYLLNITLYK